MIKFLCLLFAGVTVNCVQDWTGNRKQNWTEKEIAGLFLFQAETKVRGHTGF